MGLRCKIDNHIRFFFLKKGIYSRTVADIEFYETKIRLIHHRCERGQIARIGQGIQTNNAILRMFL